jgi:Holliday junction resolvasome RuvABC endonuclease subunit
MFMGVDPASYKCGVAIVTKGKLVHAQPWARDGKASLEENMESFMSLVNVVCHEHGVEVCGIEEVSVSFSLKTVRRIAYFEAAAAIGASMAGARVVWVKPASARKLATGSGKGPKQRALDWALGDLGKKGVKLTEDELEAYVIAVAIEKLELARDAT